MSDSVFEIQDGCQNNKRILSATTVVVNLLGLILAGESIQKQSQVLFDLRDLQIQAERLKIKRLQDAPRRCYVPRLKFLCLNIEIYVWNRN